MSTLVTIFQGGTGANTAEEALTTLGAAPITAYDQANAAYAQANIALNAINSLAYSQLIGDGSNSVYTITHNLNSLSQIIQVNRINTGALVYPDISIVSANVANITFSIVPTANEYRVSIIGL
jgi:hypothetical protein